LDWRRNTLWRCNRCPPPRYLVFRMLQRRLLARPSCIGQLADMRAHAVYSINPSRRAYATAETRLETPSFV